MWQVFWRAGTLRTETILERYSMQDIRHSFSSAFMNRIDPGNVLGLLDRLDVEIDDDRLVV